MTRAEIEEIRGVVAAAGTLDVLLKTGWIRPRGRRKAPGRPITYGTTEAFLSHFGLEEVGDLPGLDELKGAGLLEGHLPPGFAVPMPSDDTTLARRRGPAGARRPRSRACPAAGEVSAQHAQPGLRRPARKIKVNSAPWRDIAARFNAPKSLFLPLPGPSF